MRTVKFGVIGLGLMGKEFGSAAARWCQLQGMAAKPEVVAICDTMEASFSWYKENLPTIKQATTDYKQLLANPEVEVVYVAVPHFLHQEIYCAVLDAGKGLVGEKPFGIDQKANAAVMAAIKRNPKCFVRCTSQIPFYPAVQRIGDLIEKKAFGQIIEVNSGFLHSSDLNPQKAINWKRVVEQNGEYGCMGDLGMHACHMPFRAGWLPRSVRAILSKIVKERPGKDGQPVPCKTWDNASLFCDAIDPNTNEPFPLTIKTQRIAPGETNTWYLEVKGMKGCARFTTKNPRRLELLEYDGGEQAWQQIDMGCETSFKSITGHIFEVGFSDVVQQMWAAYLHEMVEGKPLKKFAACVTPEEVEYSHRLFTAALKSQANNTTEKV